MAVHYKEVRRSLRSYLLNFVLRLIVKPRFRADIGDLEKLRAFVKRVLDDREKIPVGARMELLPCSTTRAVAEYHVSHEGTRDSHKILLYLHGGGFFLETPNLHGSFVAKLIGQLGFKGIIPRYRLAPENPFPAALDDAVSAYKGLIEQGVEPANIVLAGDSAGGCLALSLLQQLRKKDMPLPACAFFSSPGADLSGTLASQTDNVPRDAMFSQHALNYVNELYLGGNSALAEDPRVSPLRGDFEGLPPLFFMVGSGEVLLDDSVMAAEKATRAGVDARCDVWPSMPHCFALLPPRILPEAKLGLMDIVAFIRKHTATTSTAS